MLKHIFIISITVEIEALSCVRLSPYYALYKKNKDRCSSKLLVI